MLQKYLLLVPIYLPSANKLVSANQRANLSYSRSSFIRSIKLNHAVMSKKQSDQMQFFIEKRLEKRNWIYHTPCQPIIPVDECVIK